MFDLIVIGGGAAGFYGAIQTALANPELKIAIFEATKIVLGKVKVSGGGRCNVTNAEFRPKALSQNYPRGQKELLGPFHSYASGDTIFFFNERGVPLKVESDGRIFPESDSSQAIIDCFMGEIKKLGIRLLKNSAAKDIQRSDKIRDGWRVTTMNKHYHSRKILVATGSNSKMWGHLKRLGHTIITPVPSLFTFNCKDARIKRLQGLSVMATVDIMPKTYYNPRINIQLKSKVERKPLFTQEGPVLITHWGFSGPAILKLSAWAARELHKMKYNFRIRINWTPEYNMGVMIGFLNQMKIAETRKTILKSKVFEELPSRLWVRLVKSSGIDSRLNWPNITKDQIQALATQLTECSFKIEGKSTHKEEFVMAGGVHLKEIDLKTYESKLLPNLYFAGDVINIDGVTGGFNFQNAWTGAYIAAKSIGRN